VAKRLDRLRWNRGKPWLRPHCVK